MPEVSTPQYQTLDKPTVLVVFGASGHLTKTKLLPALYELLKYGHLPKRMTIVGVFRKTSDDIDTIVSHIEDSLKRQGRSCDRTVVEELRSLIRPIIMDSTEPKDYHKLKEMLDGIDEEFNVKHQRVFYLAIPPNIFRPVIHCLGGVGLNTEEDGVARRIFVEKPFGSDLASAKDLIDCMKQYFKEEQIYRIDHYIAKETVQNILTFRFKNPLIRSIWGERGIDYIYIRALEKNDIEGRANFYESLGALRDFIQSHLLQLMALVMMEAPARLSSQEIHQQKQALLDNIELPTEQLANCVAHGQYEGYRDEVDNPASQTETYALVRLGVKSDRWQGVPVLLETGKALDKKDTSIEVSFHHHHADSPIDNNLTIHIQPDEGISIQLAAKKPGFTSEVRPVNMAFSYNTAFEGENPEAYERVLFDAIAGDQTLFASSSEVIRSWEILEPIIKHWQDLKDFPESYDKGSTGPAKAAAIRAKFLE